MNIVLAVKMTTKTRRPWPELPIVPQVPHLDSSINLCPVPLYYTRFCPQHHFSGPCLIDRRIFSPSSTLIIYHSFQQYIIAANGSRGHTSHNRRPYRGMLCSADTYSGTKHLLDAVELLTFQPMCFLVQFRKSSIRDDRGLSLPKARP